MTDMIWYGKRMLIGFVAVLLDAVQLVRSGAGHL